MNFYDMKTWVPFLSDAMFRDIVALANSGGGMLYVTLGEKPEGGAWDVDEAMDELQRAVRQRIAPDVTPWVTIYVEDEKRLHLVVRGAPATPYYLRARGLRPEGVYLRVEGASVPVTNRQIDAMIRAHGGPYESQRAREQDLTFEALKAQFVDEGLSFDKATQRDFGLIGKDGLYTNLAHWVSDQGPSETSMACFKGKTASECQARALLSGSLLTQLKGMVEFVREHGWEDGRLDERFEEVEAALINALVRRDYEQPGPAIVTIFDHQLEVINVGGKLDPVTHEPVTAERNPQLARLFAHLKGTVGRLDEETLKGYGADTKVDATPNVFKVTIPNQSAL